MDGGREVLVAGQRGGEGAPGDGEDLQGSHDPAGVALADALGGQGVDGGHLLPQGAGPLGAGALLQACAHGRVGAGEVEGIGDGADVEARAADDEGAPPAGLDGGEVGAGVALVGGDGGLLGDVEDVDLVVGVAAALVEGELGGAHVHAPVELGGVGPDDLAAGGPIAEGVGEVEGELGLAGGRRADDGDARGRHGGPHSSGRSGPTVRSAWVQEARAVSRWRRSWSSVMPARRSVM